MKSCVCHTYIIENKQTSFCSLQSFKNLIVEVFEGSVLSRSYHKAGKGSKHLNLADWQLDKQTAKLRPAKVDTLVPVSAHMPRWIPLKSFIIAKNFIIFGCDLSSPTSCFTN